MAHAHGQHGHGHGGAHGAHYERYSRYAINRMGLQIFLLGEATLVTALLMLRFMLTGLERPPVNIAFGLVLTVLALAGAWTAGRALNAIRAGDQGASGRNLTLTVLLALLFLIVAAVEWVGLFPALPVSTPIGSVFYLMVGLDHLHILVGAGLLWVARMNLHKFSAHDYWGVEGPVWFWWFAVGFWLVTFVTLYIL